MKESTRNFIISQALKDYYLKVEASLEHRCYDFTLKDIRELITEHKG